MFQMAEVSMCRQEKVRRTVKGTQNSFCRRPIGAPYVAVQWAARLLHCIGEVTALISDHRPVILTQVFLNPSRQILG
jgi:hypothetical protein